MTNSTDLVSPTLCVMDLVNATDLVTNLSVDRGLGRLVRLGDQLEHQVTNSTNLTDLCIDCGELGRLGVRLDQLECR